MKSFKPIFRLLMAKFPPLFLHTQDYWYWDILGPRQGVEPLFCWHGMQAEIAWLESSISWYCRFLFMAEAATVSSPVLQCDSRCHFWDFWFEFVSLILPKNHWYKICPLVKFFLELAKRMLHSQLKFWNCNELYKRQLMVRESKERV